jgi:hypothetical protein
VIVYAKRIENIPRKLVKYPPFWNYLLKNIEIIEKVCLKTINFPTQALVYRKMS